jgi:cytochrome c-type biogenesis protein CcmH/NrfG
LFAGGQFDQSMAAAEMVLSAKTNNVRAHAILGETWAATRDWSKAIDEFENAVQFDPHEIEY